MKRTLLLSGMFLLASLTTQAEKKVVNVEKGGTLSTLLTEDEVENLTELKLTGTLVGTDIQLLRQMTGGTAEKGSLQKLDMSEATLKGEGSYPLNRNGLQSIDMEDNVVGTGMFQQCQNLVSIQLPKNATRVDMNVFWGCSRLTEVGLPEVEYLPNIFMDCSLEKVVLPKSVKKLGYAFFCDMYNLKEASLPSVEEIEDSTFVGCSQLEKVELGGAKKLGKAVFWFCYNLKTVYLPATLQYLDESVFQFCGNLQEISILAIEAPKCGYGVFMGINSKCKVYVPKGSGESYKSADQWMKLDIIETEVSGIGNIRMGNEENGIAICYDGLGKRLSRSIKGLNIVKENNGNVRKVIVR